MKIAVCDDESKILEEIAAFIEKEFSGSKVLTFSDGQSFLSAVKSAPEKEPEVLLIDIDMPEMSGMEGKHEGSAYEQSDSAGRPSGNGKDDEFIQAF